MYTKNEINKFFTGNENKIPSEPYLPSSDVFTKDEIDDLIDMAMLNINTNNDNTNNNDDASNVDITTAPVENNKNNLGIIIGIVIFIIFIIFITYGIYRYLKYKNQKT
jgi:hypothetical protein